MPNDRDTLTEDLDAARDLFEESVDIAECLINDGYRRTVVITDPAVLEKLPMDSIVVDHHGAGWQMTDRDYDDTAIWEYRTGARDSAGLLAGGARVRLVHTPTKETGRA